MQRRRVARCKLELPLCLSRVAANRVAFAERTKNVSSGGVLFVAEAQPDNGERVEYLIKLSSDDPETVSIRCVGKVLRTRSALERAGNREIVATLERFEFEREGVGCKSTTAHREVETFGRQGLFAHVNTHHTLEMAYAAVACLSPNALFDRSRWAEHGRQFETHVVED